MQPSLNNDAIVILDEEMRQWARRDETGIINLRPESLMDVAAAAGSIEGFRLNDGRIAFVLAGRICRIYSRVSLRTYLAGLAHRIERLNYPELKQKREFQVDPYGFEAEVEFPFEDGKRVCLYIETCNGQPKIAQMQTYWFLITRQDFDNADE